MKGRLLNLLAALSLPLCVASAGLWVRSCWRRDDVKLPSRRFAAFTQPHDVWVAVTSLPYWEGPAHKSGPADDGEFATRFGWFEFGGNRTFGGVTYSAGGFVYWSRWEHVPRQSVRFVYVGVPLWFPTVAAAALPVLRLIRRWRRPDAGHCPRGGPKELQAAAQYFADYMARTGRYGHTADGSRPSQRAEKRG